MGHRLNGNGAVVAKFNSSKGKDIVLKQRILQAAIPTVIAAQMQENRKRLMDKFKEARIDPNNRVSWQAGRQTGQVQSAQDYQADIFVEDIEKPEK